VNSTHRLAGIARSAGTGALAGLLGAGVMSVVEKAEQALTSRADSYVPGRTLLTLLGRPSSDDERPVVWNHLMHFGTGAALGALRGVWAATGIRGAYANAWHTLIRLGFDQTAENATGAGAPPASWPRSEQLVDVLHKTVFSVVTGVVADRLVRPDLASHRGRTSH
jgi:hypothetical protein